MSNPGKVFFPERGLTKRDLVDYYLSMAQPALVHLRERPTTLKRYVDGAAGRPFLQAGGRWFEPGTAHQLSALQIRRFCWSGRSSPTG
ncbi:MAG TPA: hypothetical protein VKV27_02905 [Solirubrobacteraceae bacterium]|nr:hypothetical protein [Solirubrobacteraceae bacterium]